MQRFLSGLSAGVRKLGGHTASPRRGRFTPRLENLEDRTLLNAGALDPTFGVGGKALTHVPVPSEAHAVTLAFAGRLLVAGSISGPTDTASDVLLQRYYDDGTADGIFGVLGTTYTDVNHGEHEVARGVAFQSDGNIVVLAERDGKFVVLRYDGNGGLDTNFGTGGMAFPDFGGVDTPSALVIQPDDKIVVAGTTAASPGVSDFAVARLTKDGGLDPGFGVNGLSTVDFFFGSTDVANAIALDGDQIIVAGTSGATGTKTFALARLTSSGGLDDGFGLHGTTTIDFPDGPEEATSVAIQPGSGKIVVAGTLLRGVADDFGVARLLPDGKLDAGFGSGGLASADFGGLDAAHGVVLQPNGKVVVAGSSSNLLEVRFALARFDGGGNLDASFGLNGEVLTAFNDLTQQPLASDQALAVHMQGDKIVVAGFAAGPAGRLVALARYEGDPPLPPGVVDCGCSPKVTDVPPVKDVTAQLRIHRGILRLVPGTGRYRQRLTLHNLGATLSGRLTLVLEGLPRRVHLRRVLGTGRFVDGGQLLPAGRPGTARLVTQDMLIPNDGDLTLMLEFVNPLRRRLRFVPRVFEETT